MGPAHDEQVERSGVDPHRHAEREPSAGEVDLADLAQRPAHRDRRATPPLRVTLTVEEQQQCVAAELDQSPSVRVGDRQDRLEDRSDDLGDLLGALLAPACEPFGELREPRDIDEDDGPLDLSNQGIRRIGEVLKEDARHVRLQIAPGSGSEPHDLVVHAPLRLVGPSSTS